MESVTHEPTCEAMRSKADLLKQLELEPDNPYLRGALPEYSGGGDQEVELCDCGAVEAYWDEVAIEDVQPGDRLDMGRFVGLEPGVNDRVWDVIVSGWQVRAGRYSETKGARVRVWKEEV